MKRILSALGLLFSLSAMAQDYPHYTMFMYNKLTYNPGYAGSRNALSVNGTFRNQWTGMPGAPISYNLTVDGPVGSYTKESRPVALGLVLNRETAGPVTNTGVAAIYAYRVAIKRSVLSFGLRAGASFYSADYSNLNLVDSDDPMLTTNIRNRVLPNFGAGLYWHGKRFYIGLSVPEILEPYFDKNQKTYLNGQTARQIRSTYLSGGYSFPVSEHLTLLPQVLIRHNADGTYKLPLNADINLSAIMYQRVMIGATYRTDRSVSGIVHVQIAKKLNIGYSYDHSTAALGRYAQGAHEIGIGFDFIRDMNEYTDPRFIKNF